MALGDIKQGNVHFELVKMGVGEARCAHLKNTAQTQHIGVRCAKVAVTPPLKLQVEHSNVNCGRGGHSPSCHTL